MNALTRVVHREFFVSHGTFIATHSRIGVRYALLVVLGYSRLALVSVLPAPGHAPAGQRA